MKKIIVISAMLIAVMSMSRAQETKNKFSIGALGAFNFNKTGVGARIGYNFTDVLRFTIDGTYYLTAKKTMDVYRENTITNTLNNGRLWDANINLNFVYGDRNFHFYLITGIGFAYGYKFNEILSLVSGSGIMDANGNLIGIYENEVLDFTRIGVSLNGGCGIEWQIIPAIRWNLEQTLNIGLPSLSTWMCKTGLAFCF